jgi:hypothetical protein
MALREKNPFLEKLALHLLFMYQMFHLGVNSLGFSPAELLAAN